MLRQQLLELREEVATELNTLINEGGDAFRIDTNLFILDEINELLSCAEEQETK